MFNRVPIAWLQLTQQKVRLLAAVAGISFAVVLMLFQLGLLDALFAAASLVQSRLQGDLVLTSTQYQYLVYSHNFSRRRVYQALGFDGVASVRPVYLSFGEWKNPQSLTGRSILVIGYDPSTDVFTLPEGQDRQRLSLPDVVFFDAAGRPEFGPIEQLAHEKSPVVTEVNGRKIKVADFFHMGSSFGLDGTMITSDSTFFKLFPAHPEGLVELGLINLKPGANAERVRQAMQAALPPDVRVLTRADFIQQEKDYWGVNTGIGSVFTFGVIIGFMVGAVIVYQVLYTDVNNHLAEFATLKALGYHDFYLSSIVLRQALLLALFGFFPGFLIANVLYRLTENAAHLPLRMDPHRALLVLFLTVSMCAGSALLAARKLRSADPADIF